MSNELVKSLLMTKMFVERMSNEHDVPKEKVLKIIEEHVKFLNTMEEILDN